MEIEKKTIAVVGAGVFGVSVANHLSRELDATSYRVKLVTLSDYVYFLPSAVRLTVSRDYSSSILPLKDVIDIGVETIKDKVVSFNTSNLILESEAVLDFDVLILATGSKWPDPIGSTFAFGDDYKTYLDKQASRVQEAEHIAFIGGGFVNSEIVGELLFKYQDEIKSGKRRISIIHNSDKLLPANGLYGDTLRSKVTDYLSGNGIKLYLNARGTISDDDPNQIILGDDASKHIRADLIYRGVGIAPNVPTNHIADFCDDRGFVQVQTNFQVNACKEGNIFAIGDVTNFRYHGIMKRDNWVDVLTKNVISFMKEGANAKLASCSCYEIGETPGAVSLGPKTGFGQFPVPFLGTVSIPSFVVAKAKCKSLFREKMEDMYKK